VIVVDASAMVATLVAAGEPASALRRRQRGEDAHAPHLLDVEVLSAIRRLLAAGALDADAAGRAITRLRAWPLRRHAHTRLLGRIHQMRGAVTSYDATYLALAETIGAPLLTCDGRLARSNGHHAVVEHHEI
jgi:predicted nucleic acid-binding protein